MIIHNQKSCKQLSLLDILEGLERDLRETSIKRNYAIIFLQSFGLSEQRARLITELQGYSINQNQWGLND